MIRFTPLELSDWNLLEVSTPATTQKLIFPGLARTQDHNSCYLHIQTHTPLLLLLLKLVYN